MELLDRIDVARLWAAATEKERRALLDELLGSVTVLPDRLVVEVDGAPALNVGLSEVGLKEAPHSEFRGVEGASCPVPYRPLAAASVRPCHLPGVLGQVGFGGTPLLAVPRWLLSVLRLEYPEAYGVGAVGH